MIPNPLGKAFAVVLLGLCVSCASGAKKDAAAPAPPAAPPAAVAAPAPAPAATEEAPVRKPMPLDIPMSKATAASAADGAVTTRLEPALLFENMKVEEGATPLEGARWYTAITDRYDAIVYRFEPGLLSTAKNISADMILDGDETVGFNVRLQEGADGPAWNERFKLLTQCQARFRLATDSVNINTRGLRREGAFLNPVCSGDRLDLAKVDRIIFTVDRKRVEKIARWCMTPFIVSTGDVATLTEPILPAGPLLDEMGQSRMREWPTKTRSTQELDEALKRQLADAPNARAPEAFSKWGGWAGHTEKATGFFHTYNDGKRWWLVDPEGCLFWSIGVTGIGAGEGASFGGLKTALSWVPPEEGDYAAAYGGRSGGGPARPGAGAPAAAATTPATTTTLAAPPPSAAPARQQGRGRGSVNFLAANLIRAFGAADWNKNWTTITIALLHRCGFNSFGNWSNNNLAKEARLPYFRSVNTGRGETPTPRIFRDFPDVFHPGFAKDCAASAESLRSSVNETGLIGYFLMNEPQWNFTDLTLAEGMLFMTPSCESRKALAEFLRKKYADDAALAGAWSMEATFAAVTEGKWNVKFTAPAKADLEEFSTIMVEKYFRGLSDACRAVDPNHLNLGFRTHRVPPDWILKGCRGFDVFSINCYYRTPLVDRFAHITEMTGMPVIIGEFHFGALDAGLPSTGLGSAANQVERGKAYRVYVEMLAAAPCSVGAHWFQYNDQSAIGRGDGENYNIGIVDVTCRPYEEMVKAIRATSERLYMVAAGEAPPFNEPVDYGRTVY